MSSVNYPARAGERQVVTGLKVNRKVNVDRRYIRTTRAMIHSLSKGIEQANDIYHRKIGENTKYLEQVVWGRINYIGMVKSRESSVYQTLASKYNSLDIDTKVVTAPVKGNLKLERMLHFSSYQERKRLEQSVWVVSFDGMDELGDGALVQGSAFMLKGNRLVTAAHVFRKAGDPSRCSVYRINNRSRKYFAHVVRRCDHHDIIELQVVCRDQSFSYFAFAQELEPNSGYRLSIVGFPQLETGHDSVSIIPCTVTTTLTVSGVRFGEVSEIISAGSSGGPVLNAFMQIVGMAVQGMYVASFAGEVALEGRNAFVSAKHFTSDCLNKLPTFTDKSNVITLLKSSIQIGNKYFCRNCYENGYERELSLTVANAFNYCSSCDIFKRHA